MKPKLYGTDRLDEYTGDGSAGLIAEVWPDFADLFRREMSVYHAHRDVFEPHFALAETAGKITGFSLLMESMMTTDLLTMAWVAVHPEHRRQGIGRDLIGLCRDEARRRAKPLVLTTSVPQFYQKLGFRIIGEYDPARNHFLLTMA